MNDSNITTHDAEAIRTQLAIINNRVVAHAADKSAGSIADETRKSIEAIGAILDRIEVK